MSGSATNDASRPVFRSRTASVSTPTTGCSRSTRRRPRASMSNSAGADARSTTRTGRSRPTTGRARGATSRPPDGSDTNCTVVPPLDIVLDDLAAPRLPEAIRALNDVSAEEARRRAPLDEDSLLDEARRQTGLDDFGDGGFRAGLRVLISALEAEADLTLLGRTAAREQIVKLLASRLRVEDAIARQPQVLDAPIERPVIIVGLPRTGTSHLHNLLSVHPELRFLPYWESCEPVPAPGEDPRARIARTQSAL